MQTRERTKSDYLKSLVDTGSKSSYNSFINSHNMIVAVSNSNKRSNMSQFEPIEGYDGYLVSKEGEVWSEKSNKLLSPFPGSYGYLLCSLYHEGKRKCNKVHRLVALTFIPNPDNKPFVNHKDGNKQNNHVSNLEWCTAQENTQHAYSLGLAKSGTENARSKLSEEDVRFIRANYKPYDREFGTRGLGRKFNVDPSVISNVVTGKTYKENQ